MMMVPEARVKRELGETRFGPPSSPARSAPSSPCWSATAC